MDWGLGKVYLQSGKGRNSVILWPHEWRTSVSWIYLGYILACGDEYEFETTKIDIDTDINYVSKYVAEALRELQEIGVISKDYEYKDRPKYQVIIFEECA